MIVGLSNDLVTFCDALVLFYSLYSVHMAYIVYQCFCYVMYYVFLLLISQDIKTKVNMNMNNFSSDSSNTK